MFVALLLAASQVLQTVPFEFGGLNAREIVPLDSPELKSCVGPSERRSCQLLRQSFADIPILYSNVVMKDGYLHSLFINGDAARYSDAVEALTDKYGKPPVTDLLPKAPGSLRFDRAATWYFKEGFFRIQLNDGDRQFLLAFGSNRKSPPPKVDF